MAEFLDREYQYKVKLSAILLSALLFGSAAIFFVYMACSENGRRIFHGIDALPSWVSVIFWWTGAAICIGFVMVAAVATIKGIAYPRRIALRSREILVPGSRWLSTEVAIPYACIIHVIETRAKKVAFLKIVHSDGKAEINSLLFPTRAAFDDVRQVLVNQLELLARNASERRESLVIVLSHAACPSCGERFTRAAAERAVIAAEHIASTTNRFISDSLQEMEQKRMPVSVNPFYPIGCTKCSARWWYGLAPRSFRPRTEPDDY